jgi:hypothetical protein
VLYRMEIMKYIHVMPLFYFVAHRTKLVLNGSEVLNGLDGFEVWMV